MINEVWVKNAGFSTHSDYTKICNYPESQQKMDRISARNRRVNRFILGGGVDSLAVKKEGDRKIRRRGCWDGEISGKGKIYTGQNWLNKIWEVRKKSQS